MSRWAMCTKGDIHFAATRAAASRTLVVQEGWFQGAMGDKSRNRNRNTPCYLIS